MSATTWSRTRTSALATSMLIWPSSYVSRSAGFAALDRRSSAWMRASSSWRPNGLRM
ncbi:MAG: hypothetical protein ABIO51_06450 [Solirubrobacteraceae bacterium]